VFQIKILSSSSVSMIDSLLEKNLLPDWLIRIGIRRLLAQRLRDESARYDRAAYVADLQTRALAEQTGAANEQHYEVPTPFYQFCLGKRLKYSSCLYPTGPETLDQAEDHMLALYAERAQLVDGQAAPRRSSSTPRRESAASRTSASSPVTSTPSTSPPRSSTAWSPSRCSST
jgi:hypothetical protein